MQSGKWTTEGKVKGIAKYLRRKPALTAGDVLAFLYEVDFIQSIKVVPQVFYLSLYIL